MENEPQTNQQNKKNPSRFWRNVGIFFSTLGVIVLFTIFYLGLMRVFSLYGQLAHKTEVIQKEFSQTGKNTGEVQQQLQQLNEETTRQTQAIDAIQQTQGQSPDQWRILEAQYLAKRANDYLQFERNIALAEKMLQAANHEIKNLIDPKLQPVRKALTLDIARLQGVQLIDVEKIYLQLIALNEKIEQLPLPTQLVSVVQNEPQPDLSKQTRWQKGLHEAWQGLQKIVVVRHSASNKLPLILPNEKQFLYQNVHAQLDIAIWGLLHQQASIYQTSLQQAMTWIKDFFAQDAPMTQETLMNLAALQKLNVQPPAMTIPDSLEAFEHYFQSQASHENKEKM